MAAWIIEPITAARAIDGPSDRLDHVKEALTQAFKAGSPITVAAGVASEAGANPATIEGFARNAGSNLAANDTVPNLPYLKANKQRRFRGCLNEAVSTVDVGSAVGLLKDASGIWVFSTGTGNKPFTVRKIITAPAPAGADTMVRIEVEYT